MQRRKLTRFELGISPAMYRNLKQEAAVRQVSMASIVHELIEQHYSPFQLDILVEDAVTVGIAPFGSVCGADAEEGWYVE